MSSPKVRVPERRGERKIIGNRLGNHVCHLVQRSSERSNAKHAPERLLHDVVRRPIRRGTKSFHRTTPSPNPYRQGPVCRISSKLFLSANTSATPPPIRNRSEAGSGVPERRYALCCCIFPHHSSDPQSGQRSRKNFLIKRPRFVALIHSAQESPLREPPGAFQPASPSPDKEGGRPTLGGHSESVLLSHLI